MANDALWDPPRPSCAESFLGLLDNKAQGRLLLHDIADARQEIAASASRARPRGWLTSFAWGGGVARAVDHSPPNAAVGPPPTTSSSPSSAIVQAPDLSAFDYVPVPTVYIGLLPAPIPAGRPTLNADGLLASLQHGVLPSDSLPERDREVWRAASRITDPISAYNICQAQQVGGRKIILTERGVAEQLARGTIQMVPVQGGGGGPRQGGGGRHLNPFAPLQRLARQLVEGQQLSRQVQQRAASMSGTGSQRGGKEAASQQQQEERGSPQGAAASSPSTTVPASGEPSPASQPQYSLQDLPARRLLASSAPPQLAWMPLRVALQLLRALPQHFVVLQGSGQAAQAGREGRTKSRQHGKAKQGGTFNTATCPGGLEVHIIPGLHVRQLTPDGSSVEFTPAFLCAEQVQALWRDLREVSGGAMLAYRRLERALMRRRLEAAAAMIAGGGGGASRGPQAGSGAQQEDDEGGGMEEPPEVSDFIRELSGQEAGSPLGGASAGGTGMQAPSGLPRLAAMFACGVVSLAAQGLSWAGNTADWLMMATPLGPRLLGMPDASIHQCRLSELLGGMQRYNREQAVASARMATLLRDLHHHLGATAAAQATAAASQADGTTSSSGGSGTPAGAQPGSGAGGPPGGARSGPASAPASREQEEAAALQYSRTLAAAAIWLGLATKSLAEDSGLVGVPPARLLGTLHEGLATALVGGAAPHLASAQLAAAAAAAMQAAPVPDSMQEAVHAMLAQRLPLLEHNGFQLLFTGGGAAASETTSTSAGSGSSTSSGAGAQASASPAAVAQAVAKHCTNDTQVRYLQDATEAGAGYSVGPLPGGRGLILVGDLDQKARQRGRSSTQRTAASFLIVGVDDGHKLV